MLRSLTRALTNKSLFIIALTLLQCACATQEPVPASSASLSGFEAISAEITVSYEQAEAADERSQTLAMNHEKWGSVIDRPLGRAPTKQL
jgi:hypothetical protein